MRSLGLMGGNEPGTEPAFLARAPGSFSLLNAGMDARVLVALGSDTRRPLRRLVNPKIRFDKATGLVSAGPQRAPTRELSKFKLTLS